jgi:hypothetical protein
VVLREGDRVGAYTVRSLIGTGGMGEVYRAQDTRLDRVVAIKILRAEVADEGALQRFFREARTVARLRHPNVIAVFDVGEHEGLPFIVMEYVAGPSLATIIRERRAVPLDTRLKYIADLCDGLSHAHERGIVHRDVKPSNVLIDDGSARLVDFGIARELGGATVTSVAGSPNYFAPEQLAGKGDHRADLFSLGATLYELLTGTRAFPGSVADGLLYRILDAPAPPLPPDLGGRALADLVSRALEKDPDRRFQSAADFKLALTALADGAPAAVAPSARIAPLDAEVTAYRRRLIEAVTPLEIRRLKYEVDQHLASKPYDVEARLLADEIERTAHVPAPAPGLSAAAGAGSRSWRRAAAYASTFAVVVIAVSTILTMRSGPVAPALEDAPPPESVVPPVDSAPVSAAADSALERPAPSPPVQPLPFRPNDASVTRRGLPPPDAAQPPRAAAATRPVNPPEAPVLPAPVPPSPSPPEPIVGRRPDVAARPPALAIDEDAIRALVGRFGDALRRRDTAALATMSPDVDTRTLPDVAPDAPLAITIGQIRIVGEQAEVDAEIERGGGAGGGTRLTLGVRKRGADWVVVSIRAR